MRAAFKQVRRDFEKELADVRGVIPKQIEELDHRIRWMGGSLEKLTRDARETGEETKRMVRVAEKTISPRFGFGEGLFFGSCAAIFAGGMITAAASKPAR